MDGDPLDLQGGHPDVSIPEKQQLASVIDELPELEKLVATQVLHKALSVEEVATNLQKSVEEVEDIWASVSAKISELVEVEPPDPMQLSSWSKVSASAACGKAWRRYTKELAEHYTSYFKAHQDLAADDHAYSARDTAAALPASWGHLGEKVAPPKQFHVWHRSGKSSQVLALGLLGVAEECDDSLDWFWQGLELEDLSGAKAKTEFEYEVEPDVLGEQRPRVTSVDYFVRSAKAVVCLEAKWSEEGMGQCSCGRDGAKPLEGICSGRVRKRTRYWKAARDTYSLPELSEGRPCPVSFPYQAIRNAAAACELADDDQAAVFALVYDNNNPYFSGCGDWPGWPTVLHETIGASNPPANFRFTSVSWQSLIGRLPLDDATREWAREKHRLPV